MVWRIDEPAREAQTATEPESITGEVTAGFRAIGSGGPITLLVGLYGLQTLVAGALDVLIVVIALDLAGMGQGGVGTLFAVMGVGGLVGAAIVLPLARGSRLAATFAAGMLLWGLPIVLIAGWSTQLGAIVALAAVGVGNTLVDVSALTLLQRAVPEDVLARAFGVLESVFVGTIGLGGILAPVLVSTLGAEGALVATGLVLPAATALGWRRLRAIDRASRPPAELAELLRGVPMLAVLPEPVLESLVSAVERVAVAAGDPVITRGDAGRPLLRGCQRIGRGAGGPRHARAGRVVRRDRAAARRASHGNGGGGRAHRAPGARPRHLHRGGHRTFAEPRGRRVSGRHPSRRTSRDAWLRLTPS